MPHFYNRRQLMGLLAGAASAARAAGRPRPNILYIMSDDHASHAISAYGSRINKTPHIDRLARAGMRLDNCFCTNSICTPSRGSIMTGQYSHVNGVYTLNDPLDASRPHVAKMLRSAGYQTAMIGKWHLHSEPTGFDHWYILPGQGDYYDPVFLHEGGKTKHKGYCTDLIGDFSLDWLRKKRDPKKPFFLMSHHKAPHREWAPGPKYRNLFDGETIPEPGNLFDDYSNRARGAANARMKVGEDHNEKDLKAPRPAGLSGNALRKWGYQLYIKDYLRCVQSVDDEVGRLLDYLDQEGLASNTIVIYTSDQGFFLGDHGFYDKRFMYEESLRMPFLIRYPGVIRPGSVSKDIALNIDFAPMFLDFAGVKAPGDMQGRSFRPVLEGRTPKDWRRSMYYRYWMHLAHHHVPAHYGVRTQRYKLIYYYGQPLGKSGALKTPTEPEWELFDLEKDPREMHSVYGDPAYEKVVRELKAELDRLQKLYGDQPA